MRIIVLVDRYLPSPSAAAKMMHDLAAEMSRLGNSVAIVTGDHSLRRKVEISEEEGLTVVRVRTGKIKHPFRFIRAINEIRLSQIIWNSARKFFATYPCDVLVYYSPTIFWSGLIRKIRALNGCGSYLILRDLFPQWAVDAGLLKKDGLVYRYFRHHELELYRTADVIGVQSPANMDYFSTSSLRGRYNLEVLFNWANIEECPGSAAGLRLRLGLQDKVIFLYGGNLGVPQDIDNILRLAENLRDEKNVFFLLVGDGSESGRIGHEIEQRVMANIMLHPMVPQSEYLKIAAECDVGLITLRRDLKTQNFPGKMLSYMQLRKPMLASVNPGNDLSTVIHGHDAGFVCDNGEDEVFREYALQLARDPALRQRMGLNAHKLLREQFNVQVAARQILAHFHERVAAKGRP